MVALPARLRRRSAAVRAGCPGWLALAAALLTLAAKGRVASSFASLACPRIPTTVGWTGQATGSRLEFQTPPLPPLPSNRLIFGSVAVAGVALVAAAARAGSVRDAHRVVRHFIDEHRSQADPEFFLATEEGLQNLVGLKTARGGSVAARQIEVQASASTASTRVNAQKLDKRLNTDLANARLALMATVAAPLVNGTADFGARSETARPSRSCRRATENEGTATEKDESATSLEEDEVWDPYEEQEEIVFDPSKQVGALPPLGYFDPIGFCKLGDEDGFNFKRAAELKHGRVCMMASVGCIVEHYVQFPGFDTGRTSFGATWNALYRPPAIYIFSIFLVSLLLLELSFWSQDPEKEPGNFGDPFGLKMYDTDMRNRELNNGRFAMFVMVGIVSAEFYTGKDAVQQLGL